MAKSMRRNHDGAFKTRLALEAVKREKTMAQFQANVASISTKSASGGNDCWTNYLISFPTAARKLLNLSGFS